MASNAVANSSSMAANASHSAPLAAPVAVPTAYKKLVVLLAHMFYAGQCPPAWWVDASEPKKQISQAEAEMALFQEKKASQLAREAKRKAQQDTTGLGIVLLTALADRQWVEEEDLAKNLNLPPKMVRKAMRFFEQEQIVQREHRKETKRGRKKERQMMVQGGLRQEPGAGAEEEEEEASQGHVITYCSLDFPRLYDTVRWRLAMVKKNLEKEAKAKQGDMKYKCPNAACGKVFEQMDVFNLMPRGPGGFASFGFDAAGGNQQLTCDICGTEIEMLIDDEGTTMGTMQDKRERQRKAKAMLEAFDDAMKPLTDQLRACQGTPPPDFSSYNMWLNKAVDMKRRLDSIANNENERAPKAGASMQRPEITHDTKVSVSISGGESSAAAGPAAAGGLHIPGVAGIPAAAAAGAGRGPAAGQPGAAAAGTASSGPAKPLPPWLQGKQQQQAPSQPAASKPLPPWLMSSYKQQHGVQPQQPVSVAEQVKAEGGGLMGPGIKQDPAALKEEVKSESKQEVDALEQDEWEEVPNAAGDGAAATAGGGEVVMGLAAAMDDDEDDWEEV